MTAHPPSDPAAEAVSALREALAQYLCDEVNGVGAWSALTDRARDNWRFSAERLAAGPLAPLLADITALRTRAEEAERERQALALIRDFAGSSILVRNDALDHVHNVARGALAGFVRTPSAEARADRLATELAEARAEVARLSKFADFALLWCDCGPPHGGPGNEAAALGFIRHHPVLSARRRALTTAKGNADGNR